MTPHAHRRSVPDVGGDGLGALAPALHDLPFDALQAKYFRQDELLVVDRFLPASCLGRVVSAAEEVAAAATRRSVPGYKRSSSVSYYTLRERSPTITALYRSPALIAFLSRITNARLLPCPEDDPHACALYQYTREGDRVGYHYDSSHYRGARYTVLLGLVNESRSVLACRLYTKDRYRETEELSVPTDPGTMVVFHGDRLYHAVTPLGPNERRLVLSLQYVTDRSMNPVARVISNVKDAITYFGWRHVVGGGG